MLSDCLEVPAYKGNRYPQRSINGVRWSLHRYAWVQANGPIPDGAFILHKCNNSYCVNPDHLYAGNHTDNMQDLIRSGKHPQKSKTHCPREHPYNKENTRITKAGHRKCRVCHRDDQCRRWRRDNNVQEADFRRTA